MNQWRVEWMMKFGEYPDSEWSLFVSQHPDRESAQKNASQSACVHGTRHIHVFGPDDTLEYSYHRRDNFFRCESEEAKRINREENAFIMRMAREGKSTYETAQLLKDFRASLSAE